MKRNLSDFTQISKLATISKGLNLSYADFHKNLRQNIKIPFREKHYKIAWRNSKTPSIIIKEVRKLPSPFYKIASLWLKRLENNEIDLSAIKSDCSHLEHQYQVEVYQWIYSKYWKTKLNTELNKEVEILNEQSELFPKIFKQKRIVEKFKANVNKVAVGLLISLIIAKLTIAIPYARSESKWEKKCIATSPTVYKTSWGRKYHNAYHYQNRNSVINLFTALHKGGLEPCMVCSPPYINYNLDPSKPQKSTNVFNFLFRNLVILLGLYILTSFLIERKLK